MDYLLKPWSHQQKAIDMAKDMNHFAFLFEPRCGKTGALINTLRFKFFEHKRLLKTLIFCPPIVLPVWKREFTIHSRVAPENIVILHGPQQKRVQKFKQEMTTPKVFITNYESLLMPELLDLFQLWQPEVGVLDESHKIKSHSSKRTKAALKLSQGIPYKYILTGTGVLNSVLDIFTQFKFMLGGFPREDGYLIKTFWEFRAIYLYDKNANMPKDRYFPDWQVKPGSLEEVNRILNQHGMMAERLKCLDLPPLMREKVEVELSPEQRKHYEAMKKDFITYLDDKACVANLAITKALRLQQIVCGYLALDDGSIKKLEKTPREKALHELLEEITPSNKVLVWSVFKENYRQIREICNELKIKYVEVHGLISDKEKFEAVARFNTDPELRVFIGHPGAGGIGISLFSASYSIFYSRNFSLENDKQAEARNHEEKSKMHKCITRIDLVASGTIDEPILERLAQKQMISEAVLRDLAKSL